MNYEIEMNKDTYRLERSQRSDTSRICTRDLESSGRRRRPVRGDQGQDGFPALLRGFWLLECCV